MTHLFMLNGFCEGSVTYIVKMSITITQSQRQCFVLSKQPSNMTKKQHFHIQYLLPMNCLLIVYFFIVLFVCLSCFFFKYMRITANHLMEFLFGMKTWIISAHGTWIFTVFSLLLFLFIPSFESARLHVQLKPNERPSETFSPHSLICTSPAPFSSSYQPPATRQVIQGFISSAAAKASALTSWRRSPRRWSSHTTSTWSPTANTARRSMGHGMAWWGR